MRPGNFMTLATIVTLAGCTAQPLPSERIGGNYQNEVNGLRASLADACTPTETEIMLEGLAILADASQRDSLTAGQRAAIPDRDAAFRAQLSSVSPACRARLNELAGPAPARL